MEHAKGRAVFYLPLRDYERVTFRGRTAWRPVERIDPCNFRLLIETKPRTFEEPK